MSISQMAMKEEVRAFIKKTGIPKTTFCKRVDISPSYLYKWFKGEKEFSDNLVNRINSYIDKF